MSRTSVRGKTVYGCTECGAQAPKWLGRCQECGAWSSLVEERVVRADAGRRAPGATGEPEAVVALMDVDPIQAMGRPSGVAELDRVLGGGLVAGSVTLLGGEPGIGKSTLLLQSLGRMAAAGARCLLVSAEESKEQVRLRAERLDALHPNVLVVTETSLPAVLDRIGEVAPDVLAVDSIQTLLDPELNGIPGSVGQVRECAHRLVRSAKNARWPPCSSGTSRRTGPSPVRARSSTSSIRSWRSRATGIIRCGCCTRSSTDSVRPTNSASSR